MRLRWKPSGGFIFACCYVLGLVFNYHMFLTDSDIWIAPTGALTFTLLMLAVLAVPMGVCIGLALMLFGFWGWAAWDVITTPIRPPPPPPRQNPPSPRIDEAELMRRFSHPFWWTHTFRDPPDDSHPPPPEDVLDEPEEWQG